jgi:hypothetical protein
MPYTFVHDVPGSAGIYAQVCARIGEDMPQEFIAQVVHMLPHGLRHIEVWESRAGMGTVPVGTCRAGCGCGARQPRHHTRQRRR